MNRYLYGELRSFYDSSSSSSIFQSGSDCKCSVRPGISFHLFTSHVPCMLPGYGYVAKLMLLELTFEMWPEIVPLQFVTWYVVYIYIF